MHASEWISGALTCGLTNGASQLTCPDIREDSARRAEASAAFTYASNVTTYGECLRCGNELRDGDWVIRDEEIRKLVVDPENVPDGVMAHKDCLIGAIDA
jgi:hypothetical protein